MRNIALVAPLLLAACGSVELTDGGKRVRELQPGLTAGCEFVQVDEVRGTLGATPEACMQRAQGLLRNRVAEVGGNAFVINGRTSTLCVLGGATITFEAYRCPAR